MIGDMIQRLEDAELRIAQLQGQVLALKTELNARRKSQTGKSRSECGLMYDVLHEYHRQKLIQAGADLMKRVDGATGL